MDNGYLYLKADPNTAYCPGHKTLHKGRTKFTKFSALVVPRRKEFFFKFCLSLMEAHVTNTAIFGPAFSNVFHKGTKKSLIKEKVGSVSKLQ